MSTETTTRSLHWWCIRRGVISCIFVGRGRGRIDILFRWQGGVRTGRKRRVHTWRKVPVHAHEFVSLLQGSETLVHNPIVLLHLFICRSPVIENARSPPHGNSIESLFLCFFPHLSARLLAPLFGPPMSTEPALSRSLWRIHFHFPFYPCGGSTK